MVCDRCGSLFPEGLERCPNCGLSYDPEAVNERNEQKKDEKEKQRKVNGDSAYAGLEEFSVAKLMDMFFE